MVSEGILGGILGFWGVKWGNFGGLGFGVLGILGGFMVFLGVFMRFWGVK